MTDIEIAVLPGDGIGPETVEATLTVAREVLARAGVAMQERWSAIGLAALEQVGTTFPEEALETARKADGILLGAVSHLDYPSPESGGVNPSGTLRRELDLYANVRPARTYPGLATKIGEEFDLVIVRENTEGFYADRTMHVGTGEVMPTPDLALAHRKVTREGSMRIAREAFRIAATRRRKVTAVHKSNVLRVSDGLFLECVRQVAREHPDVEYEEELIDAMTALLIRRPADYDVIVTTNMFGDILSDEATELSGSLGLAASLNSGYQHAMAQAQHGSAPSLAGRDVANPSSLIGSMGMLLSWLGEQRGDDRLVAASRSIEVALRDTVADPSTRTADLGGELGGRAFTRAVLANLA